MARDESAGQRERRLRREGRNPSTPAIISNQLKAAGVPPGGNPDYPHDPFWPGPTPWTGFGPPSPDSVAPRGTKEWKKALNRRRGGITDSIFQAQERGLDLGNREALDAFLSSIGITDEKGGGRHLRGLVLGDIAHGGPSNVPGMSSFLDAYRPYWKWQMDRGIQGGHLRRAGHEDANFAPGTVYDPGNMNVAAIPGLGYVGGAGATAPGYGLSGTGSNFGGFNFSGLFPTSYNPQSDASTGQPNPSMPFMPQPGFTPTTTSTPSFDMKTGQRGRPTTTRKNRYFRY